MGYFSSRLLVRIPTLFHGGLNLAYSRQNGGIRNIVSKVDFQSSLQDPYDLAVAVARQKLSPEQQTYKHPASIDAPKKYDINQFRQVLNFLYSSNLSFKKSCDNFYRNLNQSNCNGVIIDANIQKEKNLALNGYASLLFWSAFLRNLNFKFSYQDSGSVAYAYASPDDFSEMLGHQDVMPIKKASHLKPSSFEVATNLALIGAYSSLNMQTWIVESDKIFKELKKEDLFDILTKQKFAVVDLLGGDKNGKLKQNLVLIKQGEDGRFYFDGFDARNSYIPISHDLEIVEKSKKAIQLINEVLAKGEHRINFTFNHQNSHLAIFNNRNCIHGRDAQIKDNCKGNLPDGRWMLVYAFNENKLGSSLVNHQCTRLGDLSRCQSRF